MRRGIAGGFQDASERLFRVFAATAIDIAAILQSVDTGALQTESWNIKAGSSRRDFIRHSLFGAAIGGLLSSARAASNSAKTESGVVDRRRLGRIDADVSILGLGLGGEFMRGYAGNVEAGHALLESALAQGINYWDTARSYSPSEGIIAPVLARNRDKIFLASKSDARDYEGFKRDLDRSLQVLRTRLHRSIPLA